MKLLLALLPLAAADLGKDTYAMSNPFLWKAFMEKYFPTGENVVQPNSTSECNEWVKLCIDDGNMGKCQGPGGNFQLHSVGAYKRETGEKSMEQLESEFTHAMGSMNKYDPYFEYHVAFLTKDLDHYVGAFDADKVPYFASTWTDPVTKKAYKSVTVQTPGSLATGAKSLLNIEILGKDSSILEARQGDLYEHAVPRASPNSLASAHERLLTAPRTLSANGKPVLTRVHRSWASSDVSRDKKYFESAMCGTQRCVKTYEDEKVYSGKMMHVDTAEFRYAETTEKTQGPTSVSAWEAYQNALHSKCFDMKKNQGFDRLADNHVGHNLQGLSLDPYVRKQKASGYPYRFYGLTAGGSDYFLYMYAPNGWGLQVIGTLDDHSLAPPGRNPVYDFCTQGVTGHCSTDGPGDETVVV